MSSMYDVGVCCVGKTKRFLRNSKAISQKLIDEQARLPSTSPFSSASCAVIVKRSLRSAQKSRMLVLIVP